MTCTVYGTKPIEKGPLAATKDSRTYREVWLVHTDAPGTDDENDALLALLAAQTHLVYGTAKFSTYVQSYNCQVSKDEKSFTIDVGWGLFDREEEEVAPWDRARIENYGGSLVEIGALKDNAGNLIKNSAGDPFEDVVRNVAHATIEISKSFAAGTHGFSPAACIGKVNSATWNGGAARTWQCMELSVNRSVDKKWGAIDEVKITCEYNPLTWDLILLDEGLRQIVSSKKVPIIKGAEAISEPWPLNGSGVALAEGSTSYNWLTFQVHDSMAFSAFNI